MRKILLGLAATAAIATPLAAATAANADTLSGSTCTPSDATKAVTHIEYKYIPKVSGQGPTHWNKVDAGSAIAVGTIDYKRDGNKTRIITDVPAVEAVTCPSTVALTDSTGQPLAGGVVWAVAPDGNWTEIGTTDTTGAVSAELLPGSTYEFVMIYGGARQSQPWRWTPTAHRWPSRPPARRRPSRTPRATALRVASCGLWLRTAPGPRSAPRIPRGRVR